MTFEFQVDHLTRKALKICKQAGISIEKPLLRFIIQWLLVSRGRDLIDASPQTAETVYQSIYDELIEDGPTIRMLKLHHFYINTKTQFKFVQLKYEAITKNKLIALQEKICTFSGTSKKDLDDIFKKILVYIVASTKIFSTKNAIMMDEAKCALHSIFSQNDILNFVNRKKHYRISLLERLGKIMCGILLFNKKLGLGGHAIRDLGSDIQTAYENTQESLRHNIQKCNEKIGHGLRVIAPLISINLTEQKTIYKLPESISIEDLQLFNKFNYLNLQHEIYLHLIREPLPRLKCDYEQNIEEINEAFIKLHEVVKFRLAIPTELVYPHFAELYDAWYKILLKLYYLVDINKISDEMDEIITTEYPFEEMVAKIGANDVPMKTIEIPIERVLARTDDVQYSRVRRKSGSLFHNPMPRFCAYTMAVSEGLLVQADPIFGLLPFQEQFLAFKRKDYAANAEKNYRHVIKHFLRTSLKNPVMCLLFNIPMYSSPMIRGDKKSDEEEEIFMFKRSTEEGIQTEHCLPPATIEERNTYSWNIWDYRRRAIQLANLRKCQTHSAQTNITYSSRDAEIQTYYNVSSTHRGICSSSQLSRSACHILDETEKGNSSDCPIEKCQPENDK